MNEYEINWWAWPEDARIPSYGVEREYGRDENDAIERLNQRYPGIDRIDGVRLIQQFVSQ